MKEGRNAKANEQEGGNILQRETNRILTRLVEPALPVGDVHCVRDGAVYVRLLESHRSSFRRFAPTCLLLATAYRPESATAPDGGEDVFLLRVSKAAAVLPQPETEAAEIETVRTMPRFILNPAAVHRPGRYLGLPGLICEQLGILSVVQKRARGWPPQSTLRFARHAPIIDRGHVAGLPVYEPDATTLLQLARLAKVRAVGSNGSPARSLMPTQDELQRYGLMFLGMRLCGQ